jgi:serine/threonine protein kinase
MSTFNPQPDTQILIGNATYAFMSQRFLLQDEPEVCLIEGQEGFIWSLRNVQDGSQWALKVLKPAYRDKRIVQATDVLSAYTNITGFSLSQRICLTRPKYSQLIDEFPSLEYALLMPWLPWKTWSGLICSPEASQVYTNHHALDLARATVQALYELERRGCAHTDIAGGNVMYTANYKSIELLDLEGIYLPNSPPPRRLSFGSPGYQHRRLDKRGQWSQYGDRFAGAILLTEMLTWWNPWVRAQTPTHATAIFLTEELQQSAGTRQKIVRDVLWSLDKTLLNLFDSAWHSTNLKNCPDFMAWLDCINRIAYNAPAPTLSRANSFEAPPTSL